MTAAHFVVPFWGPDRYLEQLVASVQRQRRDDWTLTIVDDAHPTTRIAEHVAGLGDPRITVRRNERNLGVSANLHHALGVGARGGARWVTALGADDELLPGYVDVVDRAFASSPDAVLVQPGVTVVDEADRPVRPLADRVKDVVAWRSRRRGEVGGEDAVASLLHGNWTYLPSLAFRRDALAATLRPREDMAAISDLAHIVDVLLGGGTLVVEREVAFRYRRHAANDSSTRARTGQRFDEERRYYREAAAELRRRGWARAARAADLHVTSRLHEVLATRLRRG